MNTETRVPLTHPAGKKAVSMERGKYEAMRSAFLDCLRSAGESTHKAMLDAVTADFRKKGTEFEGSIEWHMEWVKLDLEARNEIKRIDGTSPVRFRLAA